MTKMAIEQIFPQLVGAKAPLKTVIEQHVRDFGAPDALAHAINALMPKSLAKAWCFFDNMNGFWRYEYGSPIILEGQSQAVWGTHMWLAVADLVQGLIALSNRVPSDKVDAYLARLDDRDRHRDVLCEMMPVVRLAEGTATDFEVEGRGAGGTTLDWSITPPGEREILLDVKTRITDLIQQMEKPNNRQEMDAPTHDAGLMFRSLEKKFAPVDRAERLQGAWVTTHVKQEASEIKAAFERLDRSRIHFAILGEWEPKGLILVREESDRAYLQKLFGVTDTGDFTFTRS